ncbi:unnamed protein product [Mycena citricolor]|uniref:Uncharacterized protein n=1 Tax=Mycena citricolor TaxID=2018698 RepID=A0AAD2HW21_9AGAR|nr:unnamed protein product [Mycena citricolor]CAK5281808.1 unnamed protein product [Mycena citricolor]
MPSVAFLSSEVVSTRTLYDRAQQSEPPGPKPKTPMIAGATIGSVMGVAYLIGFTIYFYKRWKRKKLNRQIEAGQATPKVRPEPKEKVVIPPDPAVLLGQHEGGENLSAAR